jgi:hypothetical protein
MKEPAQFSSLIPFSGFYGESPHDRRIDFVEERLFEDDSGAIAHDSLYEAFWDGVDHCEAMNHYAKAYVQALAEESGIAMEFEEMVSPKEYNFMTDRLFAKISRADLARMLRVVRGQRLNGVVKAWFTSRPGFISHYPNRIREWGPIADWDHNQVGTVLAAYLDKLREEKALQDESDLADEAITDEAIEEWLVEAANESATRALRISDYLRRRAERKYYAKSTAGVP